MKKVMPVLLGITGLMFVSIGAAALGHDNTTTTTPSTTTDHTSTVSTTTTTPSTTTTQTGTVLGTTATGTTPAPVGGGGPTEKAGQAKGQAAQGGSNASAQRAPRLQQLPVTGVNAGVLAGVGALLLLAGVALHLRTRGSRI
jgi:hypothetical protein